MIKLSIAALAMLVVLPVTIGAQPASPIVRIAEILEARGTVEISKGTDQPWSPVGTRQELIGTDLLRTVEGAWARLKFDAGPQWVLREQSRLRLAALSGASTPNTIQVRLESGKAVIHWTPDRRPEAKTTTRAIVETPSGLAAIQGTEWSISVDDDGRTAVIVLEGSVELSNALASITVHSSEAAEMRIGQAPILLRVINPRDRVQWVADYAAQPLRFADASLGAARRAFDLSVADAAAGRTKSAIDRLEGMAATNPPAGVFLALSDLLIEAGALDRARAHAEAGRTQHPQDARFDAMLSRIALFDDRTAESRSLAVQATVRDPKAVEGWLALGESAHSDGDGPIARQAFERATAVNPADARGWFGLGSIETDYEAFVPARRWLTKALEIDPKGPGYRGEMGTVETLANRLGAAEREFAHALNDRPGDYVAMTGRALLELKEGREADALDLLQRATFIEPKYARAQLYLGVTYYRLQRTDDAIRTLRKATQLDPKDPLPYLMESAIYTDVYQPANAIVAARKARDLMPNLKSLNQLASTQKGTANLGNSVAFFGMEQWAQRLAQESYSPFWAGSHLFIGDRYESAYARTSEYYQGLLADPTVFGGSPTFQTLLPRVAHHVTGSVSANGNSGNIYGGETALALNGYVNRWRPIGYALNIRGGVSVGARPLVGASALEMHTPVSAAAAVGIAPSPRWSAFITTARTRQNDGFQLYFKDEPEDIEWRQQGDRMDAGASFRPSPTEAVTMHLGVGSATADLPSGAWGPQFFFEAAPAEFQARYTTLRAGRHEFSGGFDVARNRQQLTSHTILAPLPPFIRNDLSSRRVFLSGRTSWRASVVQADMVVGREDVGAIRAQGDKANDLPPVTSLQPRLGASIRFSSGVLRAAFQQRTRPWAALSTLGPVATAGIPLDDSLVQSGGDQRRVRVQLDWEWSSRMFTTIFVDGQRVDNTLSTHGLEAIPGLLQGLFGQLPGSMEGGYARILSDLRDIARDASRLNVTTRSDFEGAPNASEGRTIAVGGAVNRLLGRQVSVASRYRHVKSSGITEFFIYPDDTTRGHALSFMPSHVLALGTTWISPRRIYASAEAIYRSHRFETAYRLDSPLRRRERQADWTARLAGSWETANKRWAIEFAGTDLLSEYAPTTYVITAKFRR